VARTDGTWRWEGAHGVADPDGTTVTTASRYPIASVTKLYTTVVVLRLVEQGQLRLEDRLTDLLPAEVTSGLHVQDGVDRTGEITVEHLLGHTSGLPDYYEDAPRWRAEHPGPAARG
jgi:D-alanyl-D-alanine carboxypeptidase